MLMNTSEIKKCYVYGQCQVCTLNHNHRSCIGMFIRILSGIFSWLQVHWRCWAMPQVLRKEGGRVQLVVLGASTGTLPAVHQLHRGRCWPTGSRAMPWMHQWSETVCHIVRVYVKMYSLTINLFSLHTWHNHQFKSADTWRQIVRGFEDVSRPLQRLNLDKSTKKCVLVVMPNSCPPRECHGSFKCQGDFVDSYAIGTLEECIEKCNDNVDCQWFTLEKSNDHCILYEECNDHFDSEICATGEKNCAHGYHGKLLDILWVGASLYLMNVTLKAPHHQQRAQFHLFQMRYDSLFIFKKWPGNRSKDSVTPTFWLSHSVKLLYVQRFTKRHVCGLVNFVSAVAYLVCLNLPAVFSQPRTSLLVNLGT